MFFQNTASSEVAARYMIAQYTPDEFRREPRNIGVIVEKGGYVAARFVGEKETGEWDLRRIRGIRNPDVYRLWVDYWRRELVRIGREWPKPRQSSGTESFTIIPGGELLASGTDTPLEVCDYLFSLLVSSGGFAEAVALGTTQEEDGGALRSEVASVFRQHGLLANLFVSHPILTDCDVKGTANSHRVAFYQELSHEAWAMEPIDFASRAKIRARDHAAYARYVFDDFRARSATNGMKINNVAIVRMEPCDLDHPSVDKGLEILHGSCSIVNWLNQREREMFMNERVSVANAG